MNTPQRPDALLARYQNVHAAFVATTDQEAEDALSEILDSIWKAMPNDAMRSEAREWSRLPAAPAVAPAKCRFCGKGLAGAYSAQDAPASAVVDLRGKIDRVMRVERTHALQCYVAEDGQSEPETQQEFKDAWDDLNTALAAPSDAQPAQAVTDHPCAGTCQYAIDVGMTENSCAVSEKPVAWVRYKQGLDSYIDYPPDPKYQGSGWAPLYTNPAKPAQVWQKDDEEFASDLAEYLMKWELSIHGDDGLSEGNLTHFIRVFLHERARSAQVEGVERGNEMSNCPTCGAVIGIVDRTINEDGYVDIPSIFDADLPPTPPASAGNTAEAVATVMGINEKDFPIVEWETDAYYLTPGTKLYTHPAKPAQDGAGYREPTLMDAGGLLDEYEAARRELRTTSRSMLIALKSIGAVIPLAAGRAEVGGE